MRALLGDRTTEEDAGRPTADAEKVPVARTEDGTSHNGPVGHRLVQSEAPALFSSKEAEAEDAVEESEAGRGWVTGAELERSRLRNGSPGEQQVFQKVWLRPWMKAAPPNDRFPMRTTQPCAGRCHLGHS